MRAPVELSDFMRFSSFLAVSACLWLALPATAQTVDSGLEVRVNPYAAGRGSGALLYPDGSYARSLPPLLYPGQRGGPIRLHMPGKRRIVRSAPRPKKLASAAPPPAPAPAPAPHTPAPTIFGGNNLSNVFGGQPQTAPQTAPQTTPKPAPKPAPQVASKAPPRPAESGLNKRSVILFAKDAPDPAEGALGAIKFLAGDLNAAMTTASARVELQAFGGNKGDKGSDARRLSLKRALAIRQVLIDDGVSPDRIDVRAMGGADDSGPADRVDVYVHG